MAYVENVYQGNHIAATDLQNIENNFEYLRTNFIGAGAPPDPGGGLEGVMWWDDANLTLKVRDDAAWRGVFSGDATFKIWAYLPSGSVPDGWTRDATVSDEVLAFEGGAVYTTGGQRDKGQWAINDLSVTGGHSLTEAELAAHDHELLAVGGSGLAGGINYTTGIFPAWSSGYCGDAGSGDAHTHSGSTGAGTWRIKAAVGIMLYPKM